MGDAKVGGDKEYHMVGGEILGTEFAGSFFVFFFFFFGITFCGSVLGDTFLSFSIEILLMTHRNNFLSNPREGDAVSLLGYSAVGYLFVPDCREVISCCEWFIPCVSCCFLTRPHWSWKCLEVQSES